MQKYKYLLFNFALSLAFVLFGGFNAYAKTKLTEPSTLNKNGETYILSHDISSNGTAFTITGSNITFDLNNYTIIYNNGSERGACINVSGTNNTIRNGYIIQGGGKSNDSPGINLRGSGHDVSFMAIRVNGIIRSSEQEAAGISIYDGNVDVHHVYINNVGETTNISYVPTCILVEDREDGNIRIHDSFLINSHVGIYFALQGFNIENPPKCYVYNNFIQHRRTPGTKAPYAFLLAKSRNVEIFNNQIISDEGRGIMLDGWGQGVDRGSDYNIIRNNRIDVQYASPATGGAYVENNVYAIRDRYSSGNNTVDGNTIIVDNKTGGITTGFFVGSDSRDRLMVNLLFRDNIIIVKDDGNQASAVRYGEAEEVDVINNKYSAKPFSMDSWGSSVIDLTESGNSKLSLLSYTPQAPTDLTITKFINSYLLQWADNLDKNESQTFEYIVYRDGQKLDISPRGGTFFVDDDVTGEHTYAVGAINLDGAESSKSVTVSTADAKIGWGDVQNIGPPAPTNLRIPK